MRVLPSLLATAAVLALAPAAPASAQTADPVCPRLTLSVPDEEGNSATRYGGSVRLRATSSDPRTTYDLEVVRPYTGTVRSGNGTEVFWSVTPSENTDLRLRSTRPGESSCVSGVVHTYVEPAISIAATRTGTRQYVFTGRVLPGRGQLVSLYRLDPQRGQVLTAQGRVRSDGTYRIERTFSGTGRFEMHTSVPASSTNLRGTSAARSTVIH